MEINWFILSKMNQIKHKLRGKQMKGKKVKFILRLASEDWSIAKNRQIKLEVIVRKNNDKETELKQ